MCGLTGFCDFSKTLTKENLLIANNTLIHRGPNSGDTGFFSTINANIGLGHRRLSILDVSTNGSQPMFSDDGSVVIILNGEIYNFKEVRSELIEIGYSFHSNSDTEVIIKAYQQYGINSVNKFIGMFAFVIYDMNKQVIFLLRDRAGVKPLYYFRKENYLLFSSELKSIYTYPVFEKNINEQAISLYFKYGYIRGPQTIFENTFKVEPGHYLKIDLSKKKVENVQYYNILDFYNKPKLKISEEDATNEVERLFISSFEYRLVSDVPVGIFLSGGYDSSIVTAILQKTSSQKLKTFTIGFHEEKYNEAPHAKVIAEYLGTDHNEYYCTTKEAQDIFPLLADIYDEPFGSTSAIPTTLVSRFAKKQVTVSLSADGGDEIFAGYNRYEHLRNMNNIFTKSPRILLGAGIKLSKVSLNLFPFFKNKSSKIDRLSQIFNKYENHGIADVFSQQYADLDLMQLLPGYDKNIGLYDCIGKINNENDFINTCLALDYKTYMVDDILVKVDRATMSVGLEGREPLLDNRIIEFVSQLPSDLKYRKRDKKYLLKKIAHKYIPKELLDRPKTGFGLPVYEWLKTDLKEHLYFYISERQLSKHNYIDIKAAITLRDDFIKGRNNNETQIWLLLIFQMWWNRWMEN